MLQNRLTTFLIVLLFAVVVHAQNDTTIVLDEVVLSDAKLYRFSNGIKIKTLADSAIAENNASLTNILRYNSTVYFRENGYGMVSSPSFRGTSAQHTAVIWNGININSQLNGQIDFNTITTYGYDNVVIRSGGGSTQYGSGAIGGSIHLNNSFKFSKHFENSLQLGYGSFNTSKVSYKTSYGREKFFWGFNTGYVSSDNDYKYLDTDKKNENGAFKNVGLSTRLGYFISENNLIKFYFNGFFGNRDFSGTLTAPSNDNYRDSNSRSLLEWVNFNNNRVSRLKMAHLYERYRYYANKERDEFSFGRAQTALLNYDYKYHIKDISLNGILDYNRIWAEGSSIETTNRDQMAVMLLLSHKINKRMTYGVNLRKDWVDDFDSPFIFSLDGKYSLNDNYSININTSKNYRIPTFNDLYWVGAGAIGNKNITPETSYQFELGNAFKKNGYQLNLTGYYIASDDLIQWRPNVEGIWSPINIKEVTQYGIEVDADIEFKLGKNKLLFKNQYAYTKSVDNDSRKQLIYVPEHKFTMNIAYQYMKWSVFYQLLYNGSVFTTTDNSSSLSAYSVSNIGIERTIYEKSKLTCNITLKINNLLNKKYQNVAFRPMPNINSQIQINLKF